MSGASFFTGLLPSSPIGASNHASHEATTPAQLLDAARASAARGVGPWGPVAAPHVLASPSAGPNLTFGVVMTYDEYDGYVLAVCLNATGPSNTYGPTELTWKFAAGNWTEISTTGQVPATLSPGLVYDGHDQYVLLYGGRLMDTGASFAPITNQTWRYSGGTWSNLSANSTPAPFAVDFANPVYDAADEYVVLYNEIGITPTNPNGYYQTTWTYVAGTWNNLTATAGTPPEILGAMAYDAADGYVVYFGGYTWSNALTGATWTFHAGGWTNITSTLTLAPSPRINFGIAYDSVHGQVLLYGGLDQLYVYNNSAFSYETWAYASGSWTLLSSSGTVWSTQTMTFDAADSEAVLLGSNSSLTVPANVVTWTYSAGVWTVAAPVFVHGSHVTDVGQAVTLYVSRSLNEGGLTYLYQGLPPGCVSADSPSLTCAPTMAGTFDVTVTVSGAAGFLATDATTIQVNPAPTVLSFTSTISLGEVGRPIGFTTDAAAGTGTLAYDYIGLPPGCLSSNSATLSCIPLASGIYDVTAEVTDAVGVTVTGVDQVQIAPALQAVGLLATPAVIDVGQLTTVAATWTGGVGTVDVTFSGLPSGCASTGTGTMACHPAAAGALSVGFHATDALGGTTLGSTSVLVNALPTVQSVVPSNASIVTGGSVSLVTTFSGGTAPFHYQYLGLPVGCTAPDSPVLSCTSLPTGNFSISVTVVDATGATASGVGSFSVTAPPTVVGPTPVAVAHDAAGFWWGLGLGTIAILIAAGAGGYRLVQARRGEQMVQALRAGEGDETDLMDEASVAIPPDSPEAP